MQIMVTHSTLYLWLRPRMNCAQRLLAFDIRITPTPAGTAECLDQHGNLALNARFDAATTELRASQFTVGMLRANPFDYVLAGESLRLPLWYRDPLRTALAPHRTDAHVADSVKQYAPAAAAGAQRNARAFLVMLWRNIFQTYRQMIRPSGPPWASGQTLSSQEASCRDLAVRFCDVCRVMQIAARFVSAYECAAASNQEYYMHAWAVVYLPRIGWRGYDPSRGLGRLPSLSLQVENAA